MHFLPIFRQTGVRKNRNVNNAANYERVLMDTRDRIYSLFLYLQQVFLFF